MENFIKKIRKIINQTIRNIFEIKEIPKFVVEKTKKIEFGNYSSNIAFVLAKILKKNPIEIGEIISNSIKDEVFEKIEVRKPGFVNFYFSNSIYKKIILHINKKKIDFGQYKNKNKAVNIEYVSANPTGSLHLGHARNAAVGSTLANVFEKYGYVVDREYYVNDAGNQINILGVSVLINYLKLFGIKNEVPKDFYSGEEPKIVAHYLKENYGNKFLKTRYNGSVILNEHDRNIINNFSKSFLLEIIKKTLKKFNAKFDIYYLETEVYEKKLIPKYLEKMIDYIYLKDGAIWLKTIKFNDDKDRVLVKSDGDMTYFTPDIVYHSKKLSRRNYEKIIDILGADHGEYQKRMQIAIKMSGYDANLVVITLQMIKLTKNGEAFKMSKRSGVGITMSDLIETMGTNAARWFLLTQDANSHLEIDVEKCMKKDNSNHFYYVMYSYSRICKILKKEKYKDYLKDNTNLEHFKEKEIIDHLSFFPILIENLAIMYELQKIPNYLYELANLFNSYYASVKIIIEDEKLKNSRLNLINAIKWTFYSGLKLMGIEPKEKI